MYIYIYIYINIWIKSVVLKSFKAVELLFQAKCCMEPQYLKPLEGELPWRSSD